VRYLRRFAAGEKGSDHYHDASVETGIELHPVGLDASTPASRQRRKASDPPWPAECTCGYAFKVGDERQVYLRRLYRDEAGAEWTLSWRWEHDPRAAPAGSMWDAPWLPASYRRNFDGLALTVRCPNGLDWQVDGPATNGGRWERTGDPKRPSTLTVTPSIAIGKPEDPIFYHGFLQQGRLTAHIG
jgi:hypothetical protein